MRTCTALATVMATVMSISGYALAQGGGATPPEQPTASGGAQPGNCPSRAAVDANSDGTVNDEEARKHRDEVFAALDANDNNIVTREEYRDCLASLQPSQSLDLTESPQGGQQGSESGASGQTAFQKLDANSDSYVSAQEMLDAHKRQFEAKAQDGKIQIEQGSAEGGASFAAADMNDDGTVTADEAAAQAGWSFAMMDADGDTRISQQEWQTAMQQRQAQEQSQQQGQQAQQQQGQGQQQKDFSKAFSVIDSDGNGQINKQEFTKFGEQAFSQAGQAGEPVTVWVYREYYVY